MLKGGEYSFTQLEEQMQGVPTEKLTEEVRKLKETSSLDRYFFLLVVLTPFFLAHIFTDETLSGGEATEGVIGLAQFHKGFLED